MHTQSISLDRLHPHPDNANAMPAPAYAKLKNHLGRTGRYPPIIVRPLPTSPDVETAEDHADPGAYQILDGHHRVSALRELGHVEARCEVWHVDDAEAGVALATLNRLEGRDDPHRRAALLRNLRDHLSEAELADCLPEDIAGVRRLLELTPAPNPPAAPQPLSQMPVAVHFFLLPDQKAQLESALQSIGGARESALMSLVDSR